MMMLAIIAGGVALLLFGVRYLRKGLDRLFGRKLGIWIQRAGHGRGRAFFTGLGVSVVMPSSTTISMLAVQAVQAKQMAVTQMLAVMLGANVGLTIMIQIVALDLDALAPLLILIGVILYQYTQHPRLRGVGQTVLSLGLIFLALGLIKSAVPAEIDSDGDLATLIRIAGHYPLLLMLIAAVLTMLVQSSTATIGLVIGLIAGGLVSYEVALPTVFGANVGLAATTLLIGWGQVESRRMALGNLALKSIVAMIGIALAPLLLSILQPARMPVPIVVAGVHTTFNILVALIGLPMLQVMARLLSSVVPDPRAGEEEPLGPKYISRRTPDSPALGFGLSMKEITRVSELIRGMFNDVWTALEKNDERLAEDVARRDDQVDLLDDEIKRYLTTLLADDNEQVNRREQMFQLRYLSDLETIGDIIDKNISELVLKKIRIGAEFSDDGWRDLCEFHRLVSDNLLIAETVFTTRDRELADQLTRHKDHLGRLDLEMRDRHFARLTSQTRASHETSAIHLDLQTHLKRINSAATHVARTLLEEDSPESPANRAIAAD